MLDTNILIEKESGTTTIFNAIEYPPAADSCEILYPTNQDYALAYKLSIHLRDIGKPQQAVDVLIAAMCINREIELVTKDSDYENIKSVEPGFKLKLKRQLL
ncbi:PIN domain-containing protein [Candidatus Woesearchaeota archaeon]|nr:PIN domain-containing protein [Candidatus Woesearchaeota archaeon]